MSVPWFALAVSAVAGVEQVQLAGVEPQPQLLTLPGPAGGIAPGDDLVAARRVAGACVGGQLLQLLGGGAGAVHQGGVLEMLRPDPDDEVTAGSGPLELGPHLGRDHDVPEGGPQAAVLQGAGKEVHRRRADEAGHEQVARPLVQLLGGADLLDDAGPHDRDAVAHGEGLGLVVGDVDGGGAQLVLEPATVVRICTRSLASRLDRGSSIRKAWGLRTMARPMATRWRWPPDRLAGLRSSSSVSSRSSAAWLTLRSISARSTRASLSPKPMFSRTVMCRYRA